MNRQGLGVVVIAGFVSSTIFATAENDTELRGVWVTSSGSVDTSTPKSIVRDLVKPGMTDEEKALAIFNWYRRVIFPHAYLADDRRDVLRQINSYGNTLCGSHAAVLGWLMREAGFKTRCVFINNGGHTFLDVFYDNAWHSLDPETDFAVWSRGPNRHLICMEELQADPTLLDNVEEEGRAKPWLFKAMKYPWTTRKKMAALCEGGSNRLDKAAMQWSSGILKDQTMKEYFVEGVKTLKHSAENEPYGGRVSDPDLMKITLRPHERLVRRWYNEGQGKYIFGQGFLGYPAHLLYGGGADEHDEEIFRYVEPYRKDNYGFAELPVDRCYRYSGNGHLVWEPDIQRGELTSASNVRRENVTLDHKGGVIRPVERGRPGVLTVPVRSSYALVCTDITLSFYRRSTNETLRLAVNDGKQWKTLWTANETGETTQTISYAKAINGRFQYELRFELSSATDVSAVCIKKVVFDHTFVNNWLVLPHLEPGENTIRVRLDNPEALSRLALWLQYDWEEGEGWHTPRSVRQQITSSPFEFKITAAGPKFPRMKELTLLVLPRE
ncbi:MAG: transglutaminase-like domain-containing protein [Kiritimatiellae bacterium]|nr:transglutaminase-like domain-containing protein [Kiritimatiellia bacterium]